MTAFDAISTPDDLAYSSTHLTSLEATESETPVPSWAVPYVNGLYMGLAMLFTETSPVAIAVLGNGWDGDEDLVYRALENETVADFNQRLAREVSFHKMDRVFWMVPTVVGVGSGGTHVFDVAEDDGKGFRPGVFWYAHRLGEDPTSGIVQVDTDGADPVFGLRAASSRLAGSPLVTSILFMAEAQE